ncbi:hypothetical protein TNCT_347481 [Trichonephila clavata]|uniref:Uncharacterized protein n=1 Tax=Trichonephila clavata TaxID=2740835 RepID=A0A8X6FVL2_TRICU|nr:hypothetical protein TNCT_347481 [Trichonephila clavata]
MLYAEPWEHSIAIVILPIVIFRSTRINFSTCCSVDFFAIKMDAHFDLHQQFWSSLVKISLPNCALFYVVNTFLHKQVYFSIDIFYIKVLLPTKIEPPQAALLSYNNSTPSSSL